jgi:hypothetical protein
VRCRGRRFSRPLQLNNSAYRAELALYRVDDREKGELAGGGLVREGVVDVAEAGEHVLEGVVVLDFDVEVGGTG